MPPSSNNLHLTHNQREKKNLNPLLLSDLCLQIRTTMSAVEYKSLLSLFVYVTLYPNITQRRLFVTFFYPLKQRLC